MPPLCKIPTRFPVESRPLEDRGRNREWKGNRPGALTGHQLRLEINRRQMRRGAAYGANLPLFLLLSPCLADFSHPPPTIRLFSTNTKRYTRPFPPPSILYIYIYTLPWHPPRIPRGSLDFNKLMRLSKWISSLEYTQLSVN